MSPSSIQANYDRLSRWYDWIAGGERPFTDAGLRLLDPWPGERVLEIGPGTGHALVRLARNGTRPVGLDLSPGMLARARRTGERAGMLADLCQGDALRLPFPDRTFQVIFLSFTLELFPDDERPHLLAGCARTLKPGGRLGVVALRREAGRMVRLYEWFHRHWPQVVDCRPIRLQEELINAGFEIAAAQRKTMWGLPVEMVVGLTGAP